MSATSRQTLETLSPPRYVYVLSTARLPELQLAPVVVIELIAHDTGEGRCRVDQNAAILSLLDSEDSAACRLNGRSLFHASNQAQDFIFVLDYEKTHQLEHAARVAIRVFRQIGRRNCGPPILIVGGRIGSDEVPSAVPTSRFALHRRTRPSESG